jgi:exosome complex component RRP4
VDVGARQDAVLMLSSVNLEGGTLRRRTLEDALNMRAFLSEGDLLSAEIHSVQSDGSLSLHARSAKYGALYNGVLVTVPPGLIRRGKQHFVTLPARVGCDVIFGLNGFIWITGAFEIIIAQ